MYIGNKKDHCSQPCLSRHQMCRPPSSGCVRWRACGLPYPASGRRSRTSVALHVCFLTGAPRRRFTRPSLPRSAASDGGGGGDSSACRPGFDDRCAYPVTLLHTPPPANLGVPLPTMLIVRRRRWGPVIGWERHRVRPVIAPPPLRPRRRFNSDHAGKSSYSGDLNPATGFPVAV